MKHSTSRIQILALASALAVAAVACGDDGTDATNDGPTATTPTSDPASETSHPAPSSTELAGDGHHARVATDGTEVDEAAMRIVVADGVTPTASVLDDASAEVLAVIDLPSVSSVRPLGRHVLAAARDADRVELIDAGTWADAHGDHSHYYVTEPTLTDLGFDADDPTHVVEHGGLVAVFNDGDGTVVVLDTELIGDDAVVTTIESGAAHHGVAVALEEHGVVLVTTPVDGAELPDGVAVVDLETGEELERFGGCPGLHGEAATHAIVAFGCEDGVLLLEPHGDHWHSTKVDRPADASGDARTGTLASGHELPFLIGNLGPDSLVRIDVDDALATLLPLPNSMSSFAIDESSGSLLVITVDGQLQRLDPDRGEVTQSIAVVAPFELPSGHGGAPVPRLSVAGDRAFVTDPAGGQVVEVDVAGDLRIARSLTVGGTPTSVALAGPMSAHRHG